MFYLTHLTVLSKDNEEEVGYFITRLSARAKQFENYFTKGDYGGILTMFSDRTSKTSETLFFLSDISDIKLELLEQAKINGDNRSAFLESTQNYGITISDRNFNSPFETNVVYLVFFKDKDNDSAIQCKRLASYVERDEKLNMQAQIDFNKTSHSPDFCEINFSNSAKTTIIEWEKDGQIRKFENPQLLAGKNKTCPFPEIKNTEETTILFPKNTSVRFPKSNNQEVKAVFSRLDKLSSVRKIEDQYHMYQWPLTKEKKAVAGICFTSQKLRYIAFATPRSNTLQGYFLRFSPEGRILAYSEGIMHKLSDIRDIDDSIDDYFTTTEWIVFDQCLVIEKGVEIFFHGNGFPSKYCTHVKRNRLFGRQIEWNDKGEVISDVDLDIPKPWADAPKKATETVAMRMWTSSGGKYHIRAEYVSADENRVILQNEEGKVFPVALSKLSTDDQNYVKEQLKAKPELPKSEKK
jgi:hypothetical protein